MTMILLTSGAVLLLTSASFVAHEFLTFRYSTMRSLSTLGQVIATNSTAALAFDNAKDAAEILTALRAEPHVVSAGLYNSAGQLFATYPQGFGSVRLPQGPRADGYRFEGDFLVGFQPVMVGQRRLGTLFLKSDLGALFDWLRLFGAIAARSLRRASCSPISYHAICSARSRTDTRGSPEPPKPCRAGAIIPYGRRPRRVMSCACSRMASTICWSAHSR